MHQFGMMKFQARFFICLSTFRPSPLVVIILSCLLKMNTKELLLDTCVRTPLCVLHLQERRTIETPSGSHDWLNIIRLAVV